MTKRTGNMSDLSRLIAETVDEIVKDEVAKVALDIHGDLVLGSPVDTGAFRAAWSVDILGRKAVIENNMEYAARLAAGSSKQAPDGWVDLAIDKNVRRP